MGGNVWRRRSNWGVLGMSGENESTVTTPLRKTVRRRREREEQKPKRQPPYNVILLDDDDHTYAYVVAMLMKLFGHPLEKSYQMAKEVDNRGRVIVLTTTREHAELKRDQIHALGRDDLIESCAGSMSAVIEPVQ